MHKKIFTSLVLLSIASSIVYTVGFPAISTIHFIPLIIESFIKTVTVLTTIFSASALLILFVSCLQEVKIKEPEKVKEDFSDIIINEKTKEKLVQICNDIDNKDIQPPAGYVFSGPPGTGKTLAARIIASQSNVKFISYNPSDIISLSSYHTIQNLKKIINHALKESPCMIFIDEIDTLLSSGQFSQLLFGRSSIEGELLTLMTQIDKNNHKHGKRVTIIGATNKPGGFSRELSRGGRFSQHIKFEQPDETEKRDILKKYINEKKLCDTESLNLNKIVQETKVFSPADLVEVVRAVHASTIRNKNTPTTDEFIKIIKEMKESSPYLSSQENTNGPNPPLSSIIVEVLNNMRGISPNPST